MFVYLFHYGFKLCFYLYNGAFTFFTFFCGFNNSSYAFNLAFFIGRIPCYKNLFYIGTKLECILYLFGENVLATLWNNYILSHDTQKVNSFDCKCFVNHLSDLQVATSCNTKSFGLVWRYVIVKVRHSDTNFTCG